MTLDLRAAGLIILGTYALLAILERSPTLRFKPSPLLRPFFATDVAWYLSAAGVTLAAGPWLSRIAELRADAGLIGVESAELPFLALLMLALVIYDLCTFISHIALHRYRWAWRIHQVHHSSQTLDWLATTRAHASEHLLRGIPSQGILFLLGFPTEAVALALGIYGAFAAFGHSNLRIDLSRLERVFITPRLHRLHHVPATTHRNFATVFSFWDRLFGSYVVGDTADDEVLGIPGRVRNYPQSWWPQLLEPFRSKPLRLPAAPARTS